MSPTGRLAAPPRRPTGIGRIRRRTELGLILLALTITVGAYTLASLARDASLPANIGPFLAVVLALLLAAHLATRRFAPNADGMLLPVAALLNGLGFVFIARLDEDLAALQATWTALGVGAFVATLVVVRRIRNLDRYRYTFLLVGVALLLVPLLPGIGREINGARIWATIGPINFQPGEFAKIALAIFFAGYLVEKRELLGMTTWRLGPAMLPDPKHLGPVMLAWLGAMMIMTLQTDLGSSLLFFALFLVMLWVATQRIAYLLVGFALFAAGSWFAWTQFSHVQQRVTIWLDPWSEFDDRGFQVAQSIFSLAWGGVTGTGIGLGSQVRIPARETDFIFAVIGEELGLLGATIVLAAFLLVVGAGLRIALRADGAFEKLLAVGLTTLIGIQAFIILAGVTRLLPLTGITLPFVSYGGSSLVTNYVLIALLMRISDDQARRDAQRVEARQGPTGTLGPVA